VRSGGAGKRKAGKKTQGLLWMVIRQFNTRFAGTLQINKSLSEFLKWLVLVFTVMDSLIFEYTDSTNMV